MAFFEELGKKVTQTGRSVYEKTKDMAASAKIKGQIDDEEKVISEAFAAIGEKFYNSLNGEVPDAYAEQIASIKAAQQRIEGFKQQLNEIKDIVICPSCGKEVSDSSKFCPGCGVKLPEPEVVEGDVVSGEDAAGANDGATDADAQK